MTKKKDPNDLQKSGRKSLFKREYIEQIGKLCEFGRTDEEIAYFFNISPKTFDNWKSAHPELLRSLKIGKEIADERLPPQRPSLGLISSRGSTPTTTDTSSSFLRIACRSRVLRSTTVWCWAAFEPVKRAIGPWNFSEVAPGDLFKPFNGYFKSVILRISEARDLGDVNRYSFYEHTKTLMASPPDVLRCNEKFLREHSVFNVTGVIITTNHKTDGIYLPEDDRRHYVAWSPATKESFPDDFWRELWRWYENGGFEHVAAYLNEYDLTGFDPKAPPPKTKAFWDIVDANRAPEEGEMADSLDKLGNPPATTLAEIAEAAPDEFERWINDRKNRRAIPHRLEKCGYVAVGNSTTKDHMWVVDGKRQVIYAKANLPLADQMKAAEALVRTGPKPPPSIHDLKPFK
jgi:hypothetical protein